MSDRHYDHALRGIRPGSWRGLLAIVVLAALFFTISTVFGAVALFIELGSGAIRPGQLEGGVVPLTPLMLLATNVSLALMVPIAMGLQWVFFGVRPRWIWSVEGRLRWRWLGLLALLLVPLWLIYVGGILALDSSGLAVTSATVGLIVIIVLTNPLQAAGEEVGLRGLVQRSVGSWFGSPRLAFVVSTIVSAALFGLAHLAGDPWLIAYYVLFGVAMSIAAHGTGGLEAPIVIHAVNNVLMLLLATFSGQMQEGIDRSAGAGGPIILIPMIVVLGTALISVALARRAKVVTVAPVPPSHYDRVT